MSPNQLAVAIALIGSGVISAIITALMTRQTNRSVEKLKTSLERGLYVTKAHHDLELESFKRVWTALSDLRLKVRAFLGPQKFNLDTPDGRDESWKLRYVSHVALTTSSRISLNTRPSASRSSEC
jgi:hypothetical protein